MKLGKYFVTGICLACLSILLVSCDSNLDGPVIKAPSKDSVCILFDEYVHGDTVVWRSVTSAGYTEKRVMDTVTDIETTTLLYEGREIMSHAYQCYVRRAWWGGAILELSTLILDNRLIDVIHWRPNMYDCNDRLRYNSKDYILFIDAVTRQPIIIFSGAENERITQPKISNHRVIVYSYEHCWDYNGTHVTEVGAEGITRAYEMGRDQCQ